MSEALFNCPESALNSQNKIGSSTMCNVRGYEKMISCATQKDYEKQNAGVCHVNFMSGCIAFLYENKGNLSMYEYKSFSKRNSAATISSQAYQKCILMRVI